MYYTTCYLSSKYITCNLNVRVDTIKYLMNKKYSKSLFVFRRDYRLTDNTALIKCCAESDSVIAVFCFDPAQYDASLNDYFGANSFRFLIESLRDLDRQLNTCDAKLHFLQGTPWEEVTKLAISEQCAAVYCNEDYTPYALQRDVNIKSALSSKAIDFVSCADVLLTKPGYVLTNNGDAYKVFTPFRRKASEQGVAKPEEFQAGNLIRVRNKLLKNKTILDDLDPGGQSARQVGGRAEGLKKLSSISRLSDYSQVRNVPATAGTSELSAHLKFGTVSVREVYWEIINQLSGSSQLITELYWRDFYLHLLYAFPYVLGDEFQKKYQRMDWEGVEGMDQELLLEAWQLGQTGFPIVDAGMRQLLADGWMHNRVRMIVASFLTKDLHLDWREGERWFATHLVDYDPASNNGGWQWSASTGADAAPYFRIFNPWSQQKKFDPDCVYIKKYIPELHSLSPKEIHSWDSVQSREIDYPNPIVDHQEQRELALEAYQSIK